MASPRERRLPTGTDQPLAAQFVSASTTNLTVPSNASLQVPAGSDFSIAGWFKPTVGGSYRHLAGKVQTGTAAVDCYGLQIAHPAASDIWELFISTGAVFNATDADGTAPVNLNTWAFVSGTYNRTSGTGTLTINQSSVFTANLGAQDVNAGTASFNIGARGAGTNYFDGSIDAVGFWTRLLSTAEVTQLYNGGAGLSRRQLPGNLLTGLVSYWDFNRRNFQDRVGTNHLSATGPVTLGAGKN